MEAFLSRLSDEIWLSMDCCLTDAVQIISIPSPSLQSWCVAGVRTFKKSLWEEKCDEKKARMTREKDDAYSNPLFVASLFDIFLGIDGSSCAKLQENITSIVRCIPGGSLALFPDRMLALLGKLQRVELKDAFIQCATNMISNYYSDFFQSEGNDFFLGGGVK